MDPNTHPSILKGRSGRLILSVLAHGLCLSPLFSQTFPGQGGLLIPPGAPGQTVGITSSIATVSGVGIIGEGCTNIEEVTLDIVHTFVGDIAIFLIAPSGEVLEFSSGNGGAGDNFTNTVFTDFTPLFITAGAPPYNGTFRPEGRQQNTTPPFPNGPPLGTFTFANTFDGINADGDWTLLINDYVAADVGVLNSWSITFTSGGGPAPTVDLGPDVSICPGETVTLTASVTPGADTYQWNTGETTSSIQVSPVITSTYIVTVVNNGCTDQDTINVVVDPNAVTAQAGPDQVICAGESVALTGTGGGTGASYNWSTGEMTSVITVSPSVTTVYTLTVSDGGCTATDQVIITVNALPVADAGPPVTICEGEFVTLTATGGTLNNQYAWSTGDTGPTINVDPSITTVYTVTVTINGCEDEDDVEVTVEPSPEVDAGPDLSICEGESADLTAIGSGGLYSWSTGEFGEEITVDPSSTTIYTVTLTANGCDATDDVEVEVVSVVATITPDQSICEGESVTLTVTGGQSFEWSTGQISSTIVVSPVSTTTYTVTVSTGACEDIGVVEVVVIPVPEAEISPDQSICSGESVEITASGGVTYEWSSGQTGSAILVSPLITTTYTVTVSNGICEESVTTTIIVDPTPNVSAGPDLSICDGESVTLTATGLVGPGEYEWNTGETGASITVFPFISSTYSVTATHISGCFDTDEVSVTVNPVPVAVIGPDVFIQSGSSTTLTATGGGSYSWSTGETTASITVMPSMTTTYTVTVTNNGCSDVAEVTVFVDQIPLVNLGQDLTVCEGTSITLDATISAPFTFEYVWSTTDITPTIAVLILRDTSFSVTVTEPLSGIVSVDTIRITSIPLLTGIVNIAANPRVCVGEPVFYTTGPIAGATDYQWQISNAGTILSGQGNTTIEVLWSGLGNQQVGVMVSNSCNTLDATLSVDIVGAPATPGDIVGPLTPCEQSVESYQAVGTLDAMGYHWTLSAGGMIVSGQGTSTIEAEWNAQGAGTICVAAYNDCDTSASFCYDVTFTSFPSLSAGNDLSICGLQVSLEGSGSGMWTSLGGPGGVTFSDNMDPLTDMTVDVPGWYELQYAADVSGCVTSDTLLVRFFEEPSISDVIELCATDLTTYTVAFDIVGGLAPYIVNGGAVSGVQFVSDPIAAGDPYSFQVTDANGCLSLPVTGTQDCACTSAVGIMLDAPIDICEGEELEAVYLGGEIINPGDTIAFILHDGSIPDGILAWSYSPVFTYLTSLIAGQTYFITAVAGVKGSNGWPDLGDPCTTVSNNAPVNIRITPIAAIRQTDTIPCTPAVLEITIGQSSTGPDYGYEWLIEEGGSILGETDTAVIVAGSPGLYILRVTDRVAGCLALDTIEVVQSIFKEGEAEIVSTPPVCPGDCNGRIDVINAPAHWLFDFGEGVYSDVSFRSMLCAGNSLVSIIDSNGCVFSEEFLLPEPDALLVDLGPDRTVQAGETIALNAASVSGPLLYDWGAADTCRFCPSITVAPEASTMYGVVVTDDRGCQASDEVLITIVPSKEVYLPNVFSPNGDQINDEIGIPDQQTIAEVTVFRIFDRWGNLVFHAPAHLPGSRQGLWDGTFKEKELNPGVFTCIAEIRFADGSASPFVWDVTLIR